MAACGWEQANEGFRIGTQTLSRLFSLVAIGVACPR